MSLERGSISEATLDTCFATPILRHVWPDSAVLNARLRERILEDERASPEHDRYLNTNVGGWHSPPGLEERPEEEFQLVRGRILQMVQEATRRTLELPEDRWQLDVSLSAWANVNRSGDYNRPHIHRCAWTVVYYVSIGEDAGSDRRSGTIEYLDPRGAASMINIPGRYFGSRHFVRPVPGLMVCAPGWVMHLVNPFNGRGERISIACNVLINGITYS